MFDNRSWPEGYEFPACSACNEKTSKAELLVPMIAKSYTHPETDEAIVRFMNLARGVKNNFPDVFASLDIPSAAERKRLVRERGIQPEQGQLASQVAIVSLKHPGVGEAMELFAAKLLMALHYRHTRTVLPSSGAVAYTWYTNANPPKRQSVRELFGTLRGQPEIRRQRTSLAQQFDYRFAFEKDMCTGAYFVAFGRTLCFIGLTSSVPDDYGIPHGAHVITPFRQRNHGIEM